MDFSYTPEIKHLLQKYFDAPLLDGYYGGAYNNDKTAFHAATLVDIDHSYSSKYEYWHRDLSCGSSYSSVGESEKEVKPGVFVSKQLKECIDEKIYSRFAIKFTGTQWQDEWFIFPSLTFFGRTADEVEIKNLLQHNSMPEDVFWKSYFFLPYKHQMSTNPDVQKDCIYEEYAEEPFVVAIIKQPVKERINKTFSAYINEAFINPFLRTMRSRFPESFVEVHPLRYGYTLIFPEDKSHLIFPVLSRQKNEKWLLYYFFFNCNSQQFLGWTYFKPQVLPAGVFYSYNIIQDLKQISHWDEDAYLDSSCTLDDDRFWKDYVLTEQDGRFLYLELINN